MARYLVSNDIFDVVYQDILQQKVIALDTETTGLKPFLGHRIFSIIISTAEHNYYFNFNKDPDHLGNTAPSEYILDLDTYRDKFTHMINRKGLLVFMHNAKFDMHMLTQAGIGFMLSTIFCTQAMARLVNNMLPSYSLDALGALIGHKKDDQVKKYISKHKLYTEVDVGKKEPRKDLHFDQVPFPIISVYGLVDGRVTFILGIYLQKRLAEMQAEQVAAGLPEITNVYLNELKATKTLYKMEKRGVLINIEYCTKAYEYEWDQYLESCAKFYSYTEVEFQDAAACFKEVWLKLGLTPGKTAKGNDSYSAENLLLIDNPVTELIIECRQKYKRATTYFRNYLDMSDVDEVLHCNFKQGGTKTGRLSSSEPNLQNVPKRGEDSSEFPVRKCFIPRLGYFLAMIDWDQMEYRLLLDRANETEVIRKIKEDGLDVHTATAESMNVEREPAKTLNFMLLYGGGAAKLAKALGVALAIAKGYKSKYFRTLRMVQNLVKGLEKAAKQRGFIVNWLGRRLMLDTGAPYRMPNHYIQGGCGDVCKVAMNDMDEVLEDTDSHMLIQVHDEIIFEIKYGEEHLLPKLKEIMENTYPHKSLPLTAGIDFSKTDWFNKQSYEV